MQTCNQGEFIHPILGNAEDYDSILLISKLTLITECNSLALDELFLIVSFTMVEDRGKISDEVLSDNNFSEILKTEENIFINVNYINSNIYIYI